MLWEVIGMSGAAAIPNAYDDEFFYCARLEECGGDIVDVPCLLVPGLVWVVQHLAVVHVEDRIFLFVGIAFWKPHIDVSLCDVLGGKVFDAVDCAAACFGKRGLGICGNGQEEE